MSSLTINLIGGPTALIETDGFRLLTDGWAHFRQNGGDLRASFDTLGFGSRLKLLEPGVATLIEVPHARTSS